MGNREKKELTVDVTSYSEGITGNNIIVKINFIEKEPYRLMSDLGMVQDEGVKKNSDGKVPYNLSKIDDVVQTHIHVDHTGMAPIITKSKSTAMVYSSEETKKFIPPMLNEVADRLEDEYKWLVKKQRRKEKIQKSESMGANINSKGKQPEDKARNLKGKARKEQIAKDNKGSGKKDYSKDQSKDRDWKVKIPGPAYNKDDVANFYNRMSPMPMGVPFYPHSGVEITFYNNAHVMGAVFTVIRAFEGGNEIYFAITGDLGIKNKLTGVETYVPDEIKVKISFVISEATYGDQKEKVDKLLEEQKFKDLIKRAYEEKKRIVVPSYAFERLITVIMDIAAMEKTHEMKKYLRDMPIFFDTRLGVAFLNVLKKILPSLKFSKNFRIISTNEEREYVKRLKTPYMLFVTSAWLNKGSILSYLELLQYSNTILLFPGYVPEKVQNYMALEKGSVIKINGKSLNLNCEMQVAKHYTAHMSKWELLEFLSTFTNATTFLFHHGKDKAKNAMVDAIVATGKSAKNMLCEETVRLDKNGIIKVYYKN